jgi:hypothetical protein
MSDENNPFAKRADTTTRLQALNEKGYVIVVTRAFGPNGEDLIDVDGPRFSGEPGIKVHVKQGALEGDVVLSPYYGDHSKEFSTPFKEGVKCELTVPETGEPLDKLPIPASKDGGEYHAIYLTEKLEDGEIVAINDVWGNYSSQLLSEAELLELYAETGPEEE